jgi:hypothetical protein
LLINKLSISKIEIKKDEEIIAKKIILKDYLKSYDNHVDAFHGTGP